MKTDRWRKIEELYHAARERDGTLRAAYLHDACAGDDSLRREVESLLAQDEQAGSFLEAAPLLDRAAQALHPTGEEPTQSLIGQQLHSYQVLSKIGEGGMGEVYRSLDTKLRRDVALKVLPKHFARDPERMARFRREAQLLASLNHKNVAAIHGFEETPEANFLVLELIEGETFGERIQRQGALSVKDALTLASQVAEGLEAAHRKGITHRDIKPANIKVMPEGEVKVLDFGLAKAFAGDRTNPDLSELPTMEPGPTRDGQILGTPAYMSPEQVRGQEVDKRTDIWAFGCVLYELLTGQRPFPNPSRDRKGVGTAGSSVADTISAVLEQDPDWSALPTETPASIRTLLRRCLQKEANRRLHDIADARIEIEDALAIPATTVSAAAPPISAYTSWRRAMPLVITAAVAILVAGVAVWTLKPAPPIPPQPVTRLTLNIPEDEQLGSGLGSGSPTGLIEPVIDVSPDGARLVYLAQQLYLREMDQLESKPLPGTDSAHFPFFSPDGQWVGFFADDKLQKVPISGGPPVTVCDVSQPRGGSWGADDTIVFGRQGTGLWQVSAAGGTPQELTTLDNPESEAFHGLPQFLPGAKAVLYHVFSGTRERARIEAYSLETGERRVLIAGSTDARYSPTGHLIYTQEGTTGALRAVPFDAERLEITGPPVSVLEGVLRGSFIGLAQFSFSNNGTLAYVPGEVQELRDKLVWVDRQGSVEPLAAPAARAYRDPHLSPDGTKVAVQSRDGSHSDFWVYDILRRTMTRLTFEERISNVPTWTPDGSHVAFGSTRAGGSQNLFWKPADASGPAERLTTSEQYQTPFSFSPDGRFLTFNQRPAGGLASAKSDIWVLPLEGERKPQPFLQTPFNEVSPLFSPDGQWIAYLSDESGRMEVNVRPYPGPGGKWQISTNGAKGPVWSRDGRELFYVSGQQIMAVPVTTEPTFSAGTPRMLFVFHGYRAGPNRADYDVAPDGQRFLMVQRGELGLEAPQQINVVLNWFEELKQRVPVQ